MNLIGTATARTGSVIGTSGKTIRIYGVFLPYIASGTSSVILYDGTSTAGTPKISLRTSTTLSDYYDSASGMRFTNGCYLEFASAITSVAVVNYSEEF